DFEIEYASSRSPLSLWPRAGEGTEPPPMLRATLPTSPPGAPWLHNHLLRAHPLLNRGTVMVAGSSVLGRELLHGTVETRYWRQLRPLPMQMAVASFLDLGWAGRPRLLSFPAWDADAGGGIRLALPGSRHLIRVDFGFGLRDRAKAVTFGPMF